MGGLLELDIDCGQIQLKQRQPNHDEIGVMLIDEYPVFREGLRAVIQQVPGYRVVADASNCAEAMEKLEMVRPGLIITDVQLADQSGYDMIGAICESHPGVRILVLSGLLGGPEVLEAIEVGASGYLTKGSSPEELVRALREVTAGRSYLDPRVAHLVFEQMRRPIPQERSVYLTGRESELLVCLGEGLKPQDIAAQLHLSPATVKTHIRSLFRKFEVNTRTHLVVKAIQLGLIHVNHAKP